jgi:DNA-binding NtrC family response regulator
MGQAPAPEDFEEHRPLSLAAVEKQHIRRTLGHTRGHQGRAAEILGISRKALWEKRKRHGLP